MSSSNNNNPYSAAAGAYGSTSAATDQRALEGTILLSAAQRLEDLAKRLQKGETPALEEIDEILTYNRKLWQVFLDNAMDETNLMPMDIKNNVASLAVFVFKRTQDILIETKPEKFAVLISINRNIAAGLMKQQAQAKKSLAAKPPAEMNMADSLA
jgi:flagellar protein FlaF